MYAYGLPNLVAVQRISNLPIVKSGLDFATEVYGKAKKSNRLVAWSLGTAETTAIVAVDISKPTLVLFNGPIHLIDEILCKSLDMVEDALPLIKSHPDKILTATKEYVSSVVEPVLKRADSVKVLSITYGDIAAETLDQALTMADQYVNKYLPEIFGAADSLDANFEATEESTVKPARRTIRHVKTFSKTLNRRLTQRTIYEARELKNHGVSLFHVLMQMADLLAKDPKGFLRKMQELWYYLSRDEPENQAPPQNLDQLVAMLTREGARRFVHLINFMLYTTCKIPELANDYMSYALHQYDVYVREMNLTSTGMRRQFHILKHSINILFDKFFSMIKPSFLPLKEFTSGMSRPKIEEIELKASEFSDPFSEEETSDKVEFPEVGNSGGAASDSKKISDIPPESTTKPSSPERSVENGDVRGGTIKE